MLKYDLKFRSESGFKIFMAYSPVAFLREAFDELKKVTWPTRPDIRRLTIAVLAISVIVGIFLSLIDLVLERVIAIIIG